MEDDDGLMITGAKKTNEVKNYDKNDLNTCISGFKKFAISLSSDLIDKDNLTNMCLAGEVDKNSIRPLIWKTFLNVLSINNSLADWVSQSSKLRADYRNKLKTLNGLKKFSGDPLGGSGDSGWNSFFEENELKKIINLDVNRTYQDKDLFCNTTIKEMMVNILFIWSKENRDVSYKQGMNEILAVILFGMYPYYFKPQGKVNNETIKEYIRTDKEKYAKEIYLFFHDENELAGDLFFLFDAVMNKGIKDLFESGTAKKKDNKKFDLFQQQWTEDEDEKNLNPLQKRCSLIIKEKLKGIDEELYNHFIKIDINCTIFLQRWLKCIFNREFHPRDVIIIWDAIIANDLIDNLTHATEMYSFMSMDFIAVAMINYIREDLLRKDQNDCFQRLFRYPPIETPLTLIKLANQIKDLLFKRKRKIEQKVNSSNNNNVNVKTNVNVEKSEINTKIKSNNNVGGLLTNNVQATVNVEENTKTSSSNKNIILTNNTTILTVNIQSETSDKKKLSFNTTTTTTNANNNNNNLPVTNPTINSNKNTDDDSNVLMVNKLEIILKKYKNIFDIEDASDFESILETLKANLNE